VDFPKQFSGLLATFAPATKLFPRNDCPENLNAKASEIQELLLDYGFFTPALLHFGPSDNPSPKHTQGRIWHRFPFSPM